ncbi:MAG: hypothetical protein HFH59_16895 [Lachnospiraceae bacterium]|nr:hypothetical protein [Lachnospiraceae bacterium]
MKLATTEANASYITFNKGGVYIPEEIKDKSIGIDEDLSLALEMVVGEG